MSALDTNDIIRTIINQAVAYLAHGVSFLGSGNGSIPASMASANNANSSSIVSGSRNYSPHGSAVGFQPEIYTSSILENADSVPFKSIERLSRFSTIRLGLLDLGMVIAPVS